MRAWLAACVAGMPAKAVFPLLTSPEQLVTAAQAEDVVGLVNWRLQQVSFCSGISTVWTGAAPFAEFVQAFSIAAREEALSSMMIESESRGIIRLMAKAGIPSLMLKGSALAHWAYTQPHLRACSDVDLLVPSREDGEALSAQLTAKGYERVKTLGDLVAYELLCHRQVAGGWNLEVDIHWRLANSPLFANVFTFDELMKDSIELPKLAPGARGLGIVHAFIHACLHRALNLSTGTNDKLKWLYDLEVLMELFTPEQWKRLANLSVGKGVAGIVSDALHVAAATFGRELPAQWMGVMLRSQGNETLDARRLSDWRYMQRKSFESLPGFFQKIRWLGQRCFLSHEYLQQLYGKKEQSYIRLLLWRSSRLMLRCLQLSRIR